MRFSYHIISYHIYQSVITLRQLILTLDKHLANRVGKIAKKQSLKDCVFVNSVLNGDFAHWE